MKKLLGILILGLLLTSCSNKEEEVKLLERCANNIFMDNKVFFVLSSRSEREMITRRELQQKLTTSNAYRKSFAYCENLLQESPVTFKEAYSDKY